MQVVDTHMQQTFVHGPVNVEHGTWPCILNGNLAKKSKYRGRWNIRSKVSCILNFLLLRGKPDTIEFLHFPL